MKRILSLLLSFSLVLSFIAFPVASQDSDDTTSSIQLVGTIEAVDEGTITVDGFIIDVTGIDPIELAEFTEGTEVSIEGFLDNGTIFATQVGILQSVEVDESIIDVEKSISTDSATWVDADDIPGEQIPLDADLYFRIVVTNNSDAELSGLTLDDNVYDLTGCEVPDTLAAGQSFECVIGAFTVDAGQQVSFAVASALFNGEIITDNDAVYYFGGVMASVDVEKYVSLDGENWQDADSTPGLVVAEGSEVFFRITVTNTGTVMLTNFVMTDNDVDVSVCTIPDSLEVGASFDCIIGPIEASDDWHNSTVTVTAFAGEQTVSDFDRAIYYAGDDDDDLPIVIIIEGPVEAINTNIVTIYDLDIEIDVSDPILIDLEIGDILRIEGDVFEDSDTIVIIAINVIIINITIIDYYVPGVPVGCKVSKNGKIKCSGSKKSSKRS